ncbi:DNA gyrase subunit A [Patescibacteria group bacterium]
MTDDIGQIRPRKITDELQESYLDYAMSVIVSRALPDARDGLKPVHRRILYAMHKLGLRSSAKFRKSATVVGEVLGKYHPHGDLAVYDAMVRMAQPFSLRYPLVNGHGNFGSLDGDAPAAHRYTEAKMEKITDEMLADIEKETVDFIPNYDSSLEEPVILPTRIPQLLINGTVGIAVGMATNIPPHNLNEILGGIMHLIDNPDATIEDLLEFVKGPDFPTGGIIYNQKNILQAYATGKGSIDMRGKTEIVEDKKGLFQIIISEIPYQVNKATLVEKIAQLVTDKKLEGIRDVRDESDKDGVRIAIDLKKDSYPKKVLNRLFSLTPLQTTFHINMLALVDGIQPRVLTLKDVFEQFIEHRLVVVKRRTQHDLRLTKERIHILEGLKKALDHIDQIIKTIKASKTKEIAHTNLRKKFKFSDAQTTAILEMKLQQLAGLERKKVEDELKEKRALAKDLETLLKSKKRQQTVIKTEFKSILDHYGDERRTKVVKGAIGEFEQEDLIPDEQTLVSLTHGGYVKRMDPGTYKAQRRGGKGVSGGNIKEEDVIEHLFTTSTLSDILFFTNTGKVFQAKAYELPQASRTAKGQAIVNFLQLSQGESIEAVIPLPYVKDKKKAPEGYVVMATEKGMIKKTALTEFENMRKSGLIAIKLKAGDALAWVQTSTGKDNIMVATKKGQSIHFAEKDVRAMGRTAAGVRGIRLKTDDEVVGMAVVSDPDKIKDYEILIISENGYGKRTKLSAYKVQNRGGSGIKTSKVTAKTGDLKAMRVIRKEDLEFDLVVISEKGIVIRLPLKSISELGRDTQGVSVMKLKSGDGVASVTRV